MFSAFQELFSDRVLESVQQSVNKKRGKQQLHLLREQELDQYQGFPHQETSMKALWTQAILVE